MASNNDVGLGTAAAITAGLFITFALFASYCSSQEDHCKKCPPGSRPHWTESIAGLPECICEPYGDGKR